MAAWLAVSFIPKVICSKVFAEVGVLFMVPPSRPLALQLFPTLLPSPPWTPCSMVQVTARGQWDDITVGLLAAGLQAAQ